jgi:site-specific recombinase XerC
MNRRRDNGAFASQGNSVPLWRRGRTLLTGGHPRILACVWRIGILLGTLADLRQILGHILARFMVEQAILGSASTLGRRLAAIRYFHRAAGYDTPTGDEKVKAVLSGIRRTIGAAPVRKRAATADIVIAMSPTATSLRALRNRAIILLGFAGAFRRSELVALNVEDLEEAPEGMLVTLRRSKTDQEGLGRRVAIPRGEIACPVKALRGWLDAAGITEGAIFRRIFNKRAQRITDRGLAPRNVAAIVKQGRRPSPLRPLNVRRPQPARRLRYVGSQTRREPNQDYGCDRAPQPRDVENLFERRRGIRGSRWRGTALGGDMTHEDQVTLEILSEARSA